MRFLYFLIFSYGVLDNAQVEHADITRDVIWNSVLFNLDNIDFIDLMQPIVNACDCKFLY